MEKLMRFAIPFVIVGIMIGLLYFMAVPIQVAASSRPSNPEGAIVVNTLEDELNSDGDCSLREAVAAANGNTTVDACPAGELLEPDVITFSPAGSFSLASELVFTGGGQLTIDGGGTVTIDGGSGSRLLSILQEADLHLMNLALANGHAELEAGAVLNLGELSINQCVLSGNLVSQAEERGGAISNYGVLSIDSSSIINNAGYYGAGIYNEATVTISDTTISNPQAGWPSYEGAAIYNTNTGVITITNSTLIENYASNNGGAIWNDGDLHIFTGDLLANEAGLYGGGIYNSNNGTLLLVLSTLGYNKSSHGAAGGINNLGEAIVNTSVIVSNDGAWGAGGIQNAGTMSIVYSTISDNLAVGGAGIANGGNGILTISNSAISGNNAGGYGAGGISNSNIVWLTNSTISGNSAIQNNGGGILNNGYININNSTISNNSADGQGGAIYNAPGSGQTIINNSIVANSETGGNCAGNPITDDGHNIEDTDSCNFNPAQASMPNTNPRLGPLQDNGGLTWTHALIWNSPAIDRGHYSTCAPTDQRDMPRPMDGDGDGIAICDIGAFEVQEPFFPPYQLFLPHVSK